MAQPPGSLGGPHSRPLASVRPNRAPELHGAAPQVTPLPHRPLCPLPALPLILQPAVIVWAGIHLQHQLHGEPCPAGGLQGPRATLSCPEGLGGQGSGQGWGLGPPPPGPAFPRPARCRSPGSSLKIDGPGGEAGPPRPRPGPQSQHFPAQPSAAGRFPPSPAVAVALKPPCRCHLPLGIGLLQSMPLAPPALPMPLWGLRWPPSLAQACKQMAEIWDVSPQKPALICFKGPAPHSGCLVGRWGGFGNSPGLDAPTHTAARSALTPPGEASVGPGGGGRAVVGDHARGSGMQDPPLPRAGTARARGGWPRCGPLRPGLEGQGFCPRQVPATEAQRQRDPTRTRELHRPGAP